MSEIYKDRIDGSQVHLNQLSELYLLLTSKYLILMDLEFYY